jgi:hypothetical protein
MTKHKIPDGNRPARLARDVPRNALPIPHRRNHHSVDMGGITEIATSAPGIRIAVARH